MNTSTIPTLLGTDAWFHEQEEAKQAEQQAREEAARNRPAPQPQDEIDAIIERHRQAAHAELTERAKLTADQREFENARAMEEQQRQRIIELSKNPTRNAGELAAVTTQFDQTHAELERLTKELTPPEPVLWDGVRYGGGSHEPFDTSKMAEEMKKYNGHGG